MRGHRLRLAVVLGVLTLSSGAIWWVAPQGTAQQQPPPCTLQIPQPEHPLEVNTVVSDPRTSQFRDALIKHVIMEKEIFDCVAEPGTPRERRFVRDVETFIEIIQRAQGGRTVTVDQRVEELTCDKENITGGFVVSCSARAVPLQETPPPFACFPTTPEDRAQPRDPVEMNSAITSRHDLIKTIKVDKEVMRCGAGETFGDLYLFSEIVEARSGVAPNDVIQPTEKKFDAILCLVNPSLARIESCLHFPPRPG